MTKQQRLLKLLKKRKAMSSLDVARLVGTSNPFDLVHKLRKHGHSITTQFKESKDRYGDTVRHAIYILEAK